MRIVVTGGAGLIGSNVIRSLNSRGETDILVVDHLNHPCKKENLESVKYAEYMDKREFREAFRSGGIGSVSAVFHLGACSSTTQTDSVYLDDNNTGYTKELCQWSLNNGARFVYASSAATYGAGEFGYSDSDEITPKLKPLNLYGWSKQKFDLWAMDNNLLGKIAGIKFFNVFGPGENHKGDMRSVICKAYWTIRDTGKISLFKSYRPECPDGCQDRDFVYVKDAAEIVIWLCDHPAANGIFNCGTGRARTWLDLARALFKAMDREEAVEFIDMPETLRDKYQYHTEAEMSKLRNAGCDLSFRSLENAVTDYVRTYLAVRAAPTG